MATEETLGWMFLAVTPPEKREEALEKKRGDTGTLSPELAALIWEVYES